MATLKNIMFRMVNKLLPKMNRVVISGSNAIESNAVEVANYICENTDKKVYFLTSEKYKSPLKKMLADRVKFVNPDGFLAYVILISSKYIFSTHGSSLAGSSNRQIEINIWHGLLYKKIRKLRGEPGLDADVTVGTSPLSQKMFSEAFGVSSESVYISGYPRNDMMIRSNENPNKVLIKIGISIESYSKVIFWMPTFRRVGNMASNTMSLSNPFQVEDFDVATFNELLKKHNTLCLLKPHYYYMSNSFDFEYSNIKMIDDEWIAKKGITLYELLACTKVLISDFSSVMYDYSLLDRPIVCFCTDVEDYKLTQGLYFEDVENWLPTKLIQNQEEFFEHLTALLMTDKDLYEDKRLKVKKLAFTYNDAKSTERLCNYVFNKYD